MTDECQATIERLNQLNDVIEDEKIVEAKEKLNLAENISLENTDTESNQEAMEYIYDAKKLMAKVRKENQAEIRILKITELSNAFEEYVKDDSTTAELAKYESLIKAAKLAKHNADTDFDVIVTEIQELFGKIARQPWFYINYFREMAKSSHLFLDKQEHARLVAKGNQALDNEDTEELKIVFSQLASIKISVGQEDEMVEIATIMRALIVNLFENPFAIIELNPRSITKIHLNVEELSLPSDEADLQSAASTLTNPRRRAQAELSAFTWL